MEMSGGSYREWIKISPMTICYFGDYDPLYARNKLLMRGLRENGVEVVEVNQSTSIGIVRYWRLYRKLHSLHNPFDILIIGFSNTRLMVPFAWLVTRKPIVWDAFYSLYDNWVFDRKLARKGSVKAGYYWILDWLGIKLARLVTLDTSFHSEYFVHTFGASREKFVRVLIGADTEVMKPAQLLHHSGPTKVFFYGHYIPAHGARYIIEAAKLLESENVTFTLLGRGQEYKEIRALAESLKSNNICFVDSVPFSGLVKYIEDTDICLGLFGDVERMTRSIPNKVYDAAAVGRAIISGDTPAMHEVFTDRQDVLLCRPADARDLADKIKELVGNREMVERLADAASVLSRDRLKPKLLVQDLLKNIEENLLNKS